VKADRCWQLSAFRFLPSACCFLLSSLSLMIALLCDLLFVVVVPVSRATTARDAGRLRAFGGRTVRFGALKLFALAQKLGPAREVLRAVEEDFAINERLLDARIDAERMTVPDAQVCVL